MTDPGTTAPYSEPSTAGPCSGDPAPAQKRTQKQKTRYRQQRPHRISGAAFGKGRTITAVLHEGERRGLNPRPPGPQPGALPTELRPPCAVSGPPANRLAGKATTNSLPVVWVWFCHFCDFHQNFRETWRRLLSCATSQRRRVSGQYLRHVPAACRYSAGAGAAASPPMTRLAIRCAVALSGPGAGTNTASR